MSSSTINPSGPSASSGETDCCGWRSPRRSAPPRRAAPAARAGSPAGPRGARTRTSGATGRAGTHPWPWSAAPLRARCGRARASRPGSALGVCGAGQRGQKHEREQERTLGHCLATDEGMSRGIEGDNVRIASGLTGWRRTSARTGRPSSRWPAAARDAAGRTAAPQRLRLAGIRRRPPRRRTSGVAGGSDAPDRNRTRVLRLRKPTLCPLSYRARRWITPGSPAI